MPEEAVVASYRLSRWNSGLVVAPEPLAIVAATHPWLGILRLLPADHTTQAGGAQRTQRPFCRMPEANQDTGPASPRAATVPRWGHAASSEWKRVSLSADSRGHPLALEPSLRSLPSPLPHRHSYPCLFAMWSIWPDGKGTTHKIIIKCSLWVHQKSGGRIVKFK